MFWHCLVGCNGGSRNVEGCGGFPYLKIKGLRFYMFGFLGSKKLFMFSKEICYRLQIHISCFLIDDDPISKTFEILLDGYASFPGARLFEICPKSDVPKF